MAALLLHRRHHLSHQQSSRSNYYTVNVVIFLLLQACVILLLQPPSRNSIHAFSTHQLQQSTAATTTTSSLQVALSPEEIALEKTRQHLRKLQRSSKRYTSSNGASIEANDTTVTFTRKESSDSATTLDDQIQEYLRLPANSIKEMLQDKGLPTKGRKPDLAQRLAEYEWQLEHGTPISTQGGGEEEATLDATTTSDNSVASPATSTKQSTFCGLFLSPTASQALGKANFMEPTPIQARGIPLMAQGESVILHAATGSGKTLAYVLPITEALWRQAKDDTSADGDEYAMILTPTRELAAQVAGVASALAPPGSVRLVTHATNLMSDQQYWRERRGRSVNDPNKLAELARQEDESRTSPRLLVGSAKAIMHSLYGDGKMPASPTRKPAAKELLSKTRWVVLDEVDRLLLQIGKKGDPSKKPQHEKPAAILTAAVARRTFGRAQVVAASATVGRSLKREMSRILGLPPKEFPRVVRSSDDTNDDDDDDGIATTDTPDTEIATGHVGRAVTIPDTVQNYVVSVDATSVGNILTSAFYVLKALNDGEQKGRLRILLVLTKGCGMSTHNAIGALKHFRCQPEPMSLLDVLQAADGTDQLMEVHRQVSGSIGVGETSSYFQKKEDTGSKDESSCKEEEDSGYLLVTGEDSVRGLHLDGLDVVVVVGRPNGPDEYTHIAGRTGRAGRSGKVINVLSYQHAAVMRGWEKMLDTEFTMLEIDEIPQLR